MCTGSNETLDYFEMPRIIRSLSATWWAYDGFWLKMAGRTHEEMVKVVKNAITDGEVCDWVRVNVQKSEAEKATHCEKMLRLPSRPHLKELFLREREGLGLAHREDLQFFVDLIDADEGRI
jgi:Domain of unknown function (DUF5069)